MWTICFALVIIDVLARDNGTIYIIKTNKGKGYLVESGKHSFFGDSGNHSYLEDSGKHRAENGKKEHSGSDYALG